MKSLLFSIALFALVGVLSGCGSDPVTVKSSQQNSSGTGALQGMVTIGPICPVEREGQNCKPDPSMYTSHMLVILSANHTSVVETVPIHGDGSYQTELPAGTYFVDFTPHDIGISGTFTPAQAVIEAGKTTILDIHIDTGIR